MDELWASIGRILESMPLWLLAPGLMGGVIWYAIRMENKNKADEIDEAVSAAMLRRDVDGHETRIKALEARRTR